MDLTDPFADTWRLYLERGWQPLPLPANAKTPPPEGSTGDRGRALTATQLAQHEARGPHNIALRMSSDVVGIDIDHYGDKPGADSIAELERRYGPLPDTWCSTSRGDDDGPGLSRIRFYRIPAGWRLRSAPAEAIEAIQRHHRYALCWPSVHPKTGTTYRWYDPADEPSDEPPHVDDLAELPWPWLEGLRSVGSGKTALAATPDVVDEFLTAHRDQEAPELLDGLHTKLENHRPGESRHDRLVEVACWAMREAAAGCYPAEEAIVVLRDWWHQVIDDQTRRAGTEFGDAIAWAVAQAGADAKRVAEIQKNVAERRDLTGLEVKPSLNGAAKLNGSGSESKTSELPALDEAWPERQPLIERPNLPPWPVEILPDWMANHIVETADQLQVPIDLCAQFALGAAAAAAMGHTEIVLGGRWREPLNLYLATALVSGGGKSPAEKAMTAPVRSWEKARREASMADVAEAEVRRKVLEAQARDAERSAASGSRDIADAIAARQLLEDHKVRHPFRRLVDDATPEKLTQILAEQNGLIAVLSTEAELLDMAAGTYGKSPNIAVYLKAFSGDTIMVDRKGSANSPATELRIDKPLLTVSLAMQPTVVDFVGEQNRQLEARGFLARFLYSCPVPITGARDRSRVLDAPDSTAADEYDERFARLAAHWTWPVGDLSIEPAAERRFVAWLQEHEAEIASRLAPVATWLAKLQSSTLRVAGLLHLLHGFRASELVSLDTVERAIVAGEYWVAHALAMALHPVPMAVVEDAEAILKTAARKALTTETPRAVWLPMRARFRSIEEMVPALQHLEACGYLRPVAGEWTDVGVRGSRVLIQFRPATAEGEDRSPLYVKERAARAVWSKGVSTSSSSSSSSSYTETPEMPREPRVLDEGPPAVDNSLDAPRGEFSWI